MSNIFIDCGGNLGQSIDRFKRSEYYKQDFCIHSFEPNPSLRDKYLNRDDISFHPQAIWVLDGEISFYLDKSRRSLGSTLISSKHTRKIDKKKPINVPCIDFSSWILKNFDASDYIILKMDIEGAEYDVLNKMIKDNSINYIKMAFIEFHYDKINLDINVHNDLMNKLNNIAGFKLMPEFFMVVK